MNIGFPTKVLFIFIFIICCFGFVADTHADSDNAKIITKENTYHLICNQGTITIYARLGDLKGIPTKRVSNWTEKKNGKNIPRSDLRDKAITKVNDIICEPKERSSIDIKQTDQSYSMKAKAGEWLCTGKDIIFTIKGTLGRRQPDGTWDYSGANSLNWVIGDDQKCDFIIE